MQFRDFIHKACIRGDLVSTTKAEAIAEMLDTLIGENLISMDMREGILKALLEREQIGSTGIGGGLAIPHAKHPAIKKLTGVFARSREGVAFDAVDGQPAHILILLLSNQDMALQHLEALSYISKHFQDDIFKCFLLNARDEKEIRELLEEADQKGLSWG